MKRIAGTVVGLLCLAPVAQADHLVEGGHTARCGAKRVGNVKPLVQSSESIVFEKTKATTYGARLPYAYACVKKQGPIRLLPVDPGSFYRVRGAAVAGRFALLVKRSEEGEFGYWDNVVVYDIAAGRTVGRPYSAVTGGDVGDTYVESFVLKRNGSAAWIGRDQDDGRLQVWKREAAGDDPVLLDSAEGIDVLVPLRLSPDRTRVLWRSGGAERSAPID